MSALLSILLLSACSSDEKDTSSQDSSGTAPMHCDVAIIGGGVGGLHTAFRLAPTLGSGICLFEKEAELGGRIKDVSLNDDPNAPRVGVGARRVMEGQTVLLDLATELNMELQTPSATADLISARGGFAFSKEDLLPLYPTITPSGDGDTETALYDQIRNGPSRAHTNEFPSFQAYAESVIGQEGYQFLRDMSRFRADFEYSLDAEGYLDYLDEEWDVCCTPSYPVGGMSSFIRGMQAAAEADGAQIFTSDPVSSIQRSDGGYTVTSAAHTVTADKVVIAIPPVALQYLQGDVIDEIRAQQEYQAIVGVKVVTVTQWWPTPWYSSIVNPNMTGDNTVWRAWTTEHCLNFIEIPQEPYAAAANVTRSVYNDNLECSDFWENLSNQGEDAVAAEVKVGLSYLFNNNGVSSPSTVTIPEPLETRVQVWPAAWHYLGSGAGITNADLFDWAAEPLAGEDVALVGEAYNVQRSGWSDGAYKSSIHLLNTHYGMNLPGI